MHIPHRPPQLDRQAANRLVPNTTFRLVSEFRPVSGRSDVLGCFEVLLTEEDGMPAPCAINFHHVSLGQRDRFGVVLFSLSAERWSEVRNALLRACGFDHESE